MKAVLQSRSLLSSTRFQPGAALVPRTQRSTPPVAAMPSRVPFWHQAELVSNLEMTRSRAYASALATCDNAVRSWGIGQGFAARFPRLRGAFVMVGRVRWKRDAYYHDPWSLEERHITMLGDAFQKSLGTSDISYLVHASDGSVVYLANANECVTYLKNMLPPRRVETLAVSGESGTTKSMRFYLNRFLLGAVLAGELHIQFGTVSYSLFSDSENDVPLWFGRLEDVVGHLRQRGFSGALAKASMYPVRWIMAALVLIGALFVLGAVSELEIVPANWLTMWVRNHADKYYFIDTTLGAALVFAPLLLRWLYPFAVVRLGSEGRSVARLEARRMVFFRYIFLAAIVGVAAIIVFETWIKHWIE